MFNFALNKSTMEMKKFFEKHLGYFWLALIIIVLLVVDISLHIDKSCIGSDTLVIGFIGVLASIIVIGNLTQVYSIKHEFDKKIEKLEASTNQWDDFYGTFISSELFQEIVRKSEEKKPAKKTKKQNSNG